MMAGEAFWNAAAGGGGSGSGQEPISSTDTITLHEGTEQALTNGAYLAVVNLSGAHDLFPGVVNGQEGGIRITIDGTVVVSSTGRHFGRSSTEGAFAAISVPACRSTTSLKVEIYNSGTASENYGWILYTRAV